MELKDMQEKSNEIVEMIDKLYDGKGHDAELTTIHLIEEMGEIARQVYNDKHKRGQFDKENIADEIADAYILLARLAKVYNIDIEDAINKKIEKLKKKHNLTENG